MGKLLVLVLLAFVVYALWRSMLAKARVAARRAAREQAAGVAAHSGAGERMVTCHRCGVNLPVGEALVVHGEHYCSAEHAPKDVR